MSAVDTKEITQDEDIDDDTISNNGIQLQIDWTKDHENILVEWADKAMCYRWLHSKAHQHYARANMWWEFGWVHMRLVVIWTNRKHPVGSYYNSILEM